MRGKAGLHRTHRVVRRIVSLAAVCAFAGCAEDNAPNAPDEPEPPAGYTTAEQVVDAHARALTERNLAAYVALLDDEFEFCPGPADLEDFPWLSSECWGRAEEIDMVSNMFDPDFVPSPEEYRVHQVRATLQIDQTTELPDGAFLVACTASFRVFITPDGGIRSDEWLELLIVPASDGYLRIRSIRELPLAVLRADDLPDVPEPPSMTWGSMKALYRSGSFNS